METIFEILDKLGLNLVTKKFQEEKVDIKVVISASDGDLIRLGIRTIVDRIRLREACRRISEANSSLLPLDISQEISTDRPGLEERSFFSPSFGWNNGSRQKKRRSSRSGAAGSSNRRAADRTWTGQFMCLSDIHAKKIPTPTIKAVLQKAGLGFKKKKSDLEADEVPVYNQLTSSSSGDSQPDELTLGYSQLQNCGGFELMKCIPNCKVLEPLEFQISAKNLKAAAGQGKFYIRPIQRSLSVLLLKSEASPCSISALEEKCVHCYKEYHLNILSSHVLSCLSSNYLLLDDSDEGSDIVNDHSSIEIPTSSENGQHGDNLQLQSENEEIHSNESPPVREDQQNSVREINIYDEINNIIQYCKEQDFHNPVEILKNLQENLVQGRPLEIADASQSRFNRVIF